MSNRDELVEAAKKHFRENLTTKPNGEIINAEYQYAYWAADFSLSENTRLCLLLANIRTALGDPEGKMMQEDFVEYCTEVVAERDRLRGWVSGLKRAEWGGYVKLTHGMQQKFIATSYNDGVFGIFDMEVSTKEPLAKSVEGDRLAVIEAYLKDKAALAVKE